MKYKVNVQKTEEGYAVWVPGLPGCWSQGKAEQEVLENIKDPIQGYLETIEQLSKGKEAEKALLRAGWYVHHSRGSHFFYKHPDFPGKRVDIPIHAGEQLAPKTLKRILETANINVEEFVDLLKGG